MGFTTFKIEIQSLEDDQKGKKVFKDIIKPKEKVEMLEIKSIAMLEGGLQSGGTSVMICLEDRKGNHYIAQTTKNLFIAASDALKGAIERFGK